MCTAVNLFGEEHLFGRTFDYEKSFGQKIVSIPRQFVFEKFVSTYSIIGVATVVDGIPLFFDGMNEQGLCAGALNFPGWSAYHETNPRKLNFGSYELISYILGSCKNVKQAKERLKKINITKNSISEALPATPLHWIFADKREAVVVESVKEGLRLYENPLGVLTNSPSFDYQVTNLSGYMSLHSGYPKNRITKEKLRVYSRGMGAAGLPGDYSSPSRFVRAVYAKGNTMRGKNDSPVTKFFHIMDCVSIPYGTVKTEKGEAVSTIYTCCADSSSGVYYFTTYSCRRIRGVTLDAEDKEMHCYSMDKDEDIELI